jgi:hypothetical protein
MIWRRKQDRSLERGADASSNTQTASQGNGAKLFTLGDDPSAGARDARSPQF